MTTERKPEAEQDQPKRTHWIKVDIAWVGSGRDGDPWQMASWDVKECDCDRPWRHEAMA